ncbi:MAG TPA: prolyl oligopeptidase family serine peptidase, partial [Rhizomicrobium sp.]|nr:prolyl oligopeptidase family serine peptidase [Rhizomicrobium sp.]
DLYACAVSYAGIADVASILGKAKWDSGTESGAMHYWEKRVGVSFDDTDLLRAISPAYHADQVRAPVLLLHSTNDVTVPVSESEREETELLKARKKVRLVELPGDDHYLQHEDARRVLLKETEAFLAANIGN